MPRLGEWLERRREIAPLIFRCFIAFVLIYGTQDNVLHSDRMLEFRVFLEKSGFPLPAAAAYLSAYGQFSSGILLLVGLFTRLAAAVVVINFLVALGMVHMTLPFNANIAPLAMLIGGVFFVVYGAPRYSVDAWLRSRASRSAAHDAERF